MTKDQIKRMLDARIGAYADKRHAAMSCPASELPDKLLDLVNELETLMWALNDYNGNK